MEMTLSNIMIFINSVMEDINDIQQIPVQQQQQQHYQQPLIQQQQHNLINKEYTSEKTILDGATPTNTIKIFNTMDQSLIDSFNDNINIDNTTTTTTTNLEEDLLLQQHNISQFNTPTNSSIPSSPSNNNINETTETTTTTFNENSNITIQPSEQEQQEQQEQQQQQQKLNRITTYNFLEALPQEIVNYIFLKVGANGVKNLVRVNKVCLKIGMNEKLWLYFVEHDFKLEKLEIGQYIKLNGGVRALYANLYFKKKNSLPPAPSSNPLIQYFLRPISKIPALFSRKEYKALMYGLDGVGKTTMLYKFARGENVRTLHTNGYNVEIVEYKSCDFICWDIGYEKTNVPVWQYYIQDTQAIIFIIDSCDRQRLRLVREELWNLVNDKNVQKIVNYKQQSNNNNNNNNNNKNLDTRVKVLIYSNKIDQISDNPMTTLEITQSLSLYNLPKNITWHVQGCSATSEEGDGLYEGLDWLSSQFDT